VCVCVCVCVYCLVTRSFGTHTPTHTHIWFGNHSAQKIATGDKDACKTNVQHMFLAWTQHMDMAEARRGEEKRMRGRVRSNALCPGGRQVVGPNTH